MATCVYFMYLNICSKYMFYFCNSLYSTNSGKNVLKHASIDLTFRSVVEGVRVNRMFMSFSYISTRGLTSFIFSK